MKKDYFSDSIIEKLENLKWEIYKLETSNEYKELHKIVEIYRKLAFRDLEYFEEDLKEDTDLLVEFLNGEHEIVLMVTLLNESGKEDSKSRMYVNIISDDWEDKLNAVALEIGCNERIIEFITIDRAYTYSSERVYKLIDELNAASIALKEIEIEQEANRKRLTQ